MQEYRLSRKKANTRKTETRCLTWWEVPVKGGVRRTEDSRGAEWPSGLIQTTNQLTIKRIQSGRVLAFWFGKSTQIVVAPPAA